MYVWSGRTCGVVDRVLLPRPAVRGGAGPQAARAMARDLESKAHEKISWKLPKI